MRPLKAGGRWALDATPPPIDGCTAADRQRGAARRLLGLLAHLPALTLLWGSQALGRGSARRARWAAKEGERGSGPTDLSLSPLPERNWDGARGETGSGEGDTHKAPLALLPPETGLDGVGRGGEGPENAVE